MSRKATPFRFRQLLPLIAAILVLPFNLYARTYRTISDFDYYVNGGNIEHGVTLDATGNLYGTTMNGGPLDYGVVFKLTKQPDGTWAESVLHFFQGGSEGRGPVSGVTFDKNGNLYGATVAGGVSCADPRPAGCGTVYKLTPQPDGTWEHKVIYAFSGTEGIITGTELIFDRAGNLYGFSSAGNANCCGVVFSLKPDSDGSWSEEILYAFKGGRDGNFPVGNLVFDQAGNLYGETGQGGNKDCGTVFKLTPDPGGSWSESVVHSFCASKSDGRRPTGGLTMDASGNLFGVTWWGGGAAMPPCPLQTGCGTVFQLKPQSDGSWSYRKVHTFMDTPSAQPYGGVALDAAGNVYGTTVLNGTNDHGTIFMLVHNPDDSFTGKTLHIFKGYPAIYPTGTLVLDESGTLYGTTVFSNPSSASLPGVVFKMIP